MIRVTFHVPTAAYPHSEERRLEVEHIPQRGDFVLLELASWRVAYVQHRFEKDARANTQQHVHVELVDPATYALRYQT